MFKFYRELKYFKGVSFPKASARMKLQDDADDDTGPGPGKYPVKEHFEKHWSEDRGEHTWAMKWQKEPHVTHTRAELWELGKLDRPVDMMGTMNHHSPEKLSPTQPRSPPQTEERSELAKLHHHERLRARALGLEGLSSPKTPALMEKVRRVVE